jgi:hypothetical protein
MLNQLHSKCKINKWWNLHITLEVDQTVSLRPCRQLSGCYIWRQSYHWIEIKGLWWFWSLFKKTCINCLWNTV